MGHVHCDQDAICTYRVDALDRLADPPRCIKHGALLVTGCNCLEGRDAITKRVDAALRRASRRHARIRRETPA
jgi:hypothetical protein